MGSIGIIISAVIVVILILVIVLLKKISLIRENSEALQRLAKINSDANFFGNVKKKILLTHYALEKENLSKLDIDAVLKELFLDNASNSFLNFELVYKNELEFNSYEKKYNVIKIKHNPDLIKLTNTSEGVFKFLEKRLLKMGKLKPVIKTKIKLLVKYDGLNGENKYKKDKTYSYNDLAELYLSSKEEKKERDEQNV